MGWDTFGEAVKQFGGYGAIFAVVIYALWKEKFLPEKAVERERKAHAEQLEHERAARAAREEEWKARFAEERRDKEKWMSAALRGTEIAERAVQKIPQPDSTGGQ
jgi:hypothetical protein